jgi:hypothetical protein
VILVLRHLRFLFHSSLLGREQHFVLFFCHTIYHDGVGGNERDEDSQRHILIPWSITQEPAPKEEPPCIWRHLHFWAEEGWDLLGVFANVGLASSRLLPQSRDFASPGLSGYVRQALIVFLKVPHVR